MNGKRIMVCVLMTLLSVNLFSQSMTLDAAIKNTAAELGQQLTGRPQIAVVSFSSNRKELSEYVIEELNNAIVRGGSLTLVDRQQLDLVRQEQNFQMSGEVSDESAQSIGQFLGAQAVLSGSFTVIGSINRFRIRVIAVETGVVQFSNSIDIKDDAILGALMAAPKPIDTKDDAIVGAFMIVPKPQPAPGPQEPPAPEPKYTWYNGLVLLGYTYGFEQPLGFSFGIFGLYFSYGWALLDWGDYYKLDDHVAGKPPTGDRYGDRYSIDYYSSPILDQKYESTDFVMGYTVTIIPQILYSPIGVGLEFVKEWRLQRPINSDGIESSADPSWNPDRKDTVSFLLEAGLLLRLKRTIGPYLFVTYRNIGISKHSFAIGGGGSWAFF